MFNGENIANNSPSSPFRNLFVQSPMIQTPNKENVADDTQLFNAKSHSPRCRNASKLLVGRNIFKDRHPLEDHDSNSLDSGYGNSNASISSDDLNKYQDNFRFIEPYGPAPRKNNGSEFSPKSNMYSTSPSSPSVLTQTRFLSFSTGSSDLSDDGFMDQLHEEISSSSSYTIDDENAQLPPDMDSLLTGRIFQQQDIESPVSSLAFNKDEGVQRNFNRFLNSGFGEKKLTRTISLRSTNFPDDDMILLDKDVPSNKRCATAENEENSTPFLKRRKPSSKLNVNEKVMFASQPSTAPASSDNERRTLFDYGFKNSKFHRSFSETEATIKQAVQKASSNPNLIGDMSRPFALPLIQLSRHSDLKNISCNTLARLINGEFKDTVESYMIVDCRYPYEYKGGHIKGAVNIYTKQQIVERFIKPTEIVAPSCDNASDDLDVTIVSPDSLIQENPKRNILVFHCEFSSERGPTLSRFLRSADRNKNTLHYPHLDYPEVYLLDGGYSEFFKTHKHLCEPCSYLPMLHPSYTAELRALRRRSKSWASSGPPDYKSKTSSLRTRLGF